MTHEEANLKTKEAMASSLKKYMGKKPLSKITVSEIITDCNVNRKTFYYHFEDIYALLKWMLDRETIEVLKQFDLLVDYEDALRYVIDYVEKNTHILNCAYDSMGKEQLSRFFRNDFQELTMNTLKEAEEQQNIQLDEDTRKFICDFILEGTVGLIINDIKSKEHYDREKTIKNVCAVVQTMPDILVRVAENKKIG